MDEQDGSSTNLSQFDTWENVKHRIKHVMVTLNFRAFNGTWKFFTLEYPSTHTFTMGLESDTWSFDKIYVWVDESCAVVASFGYVRGKSAPILKWSVNKQELEKSLEDILWEIVAIYRTLVEPHL